VRLVLIADTFPPLRTSGAVQLRDLAREIVRQGHQLTILLPDPELAEPYAAEDFDGAQVIRLKAPRMKGVNYLRRTLAEFAMPYAMIRNLAKSPYADQLWDGVIWYSPSIFHGPLVRWAARRSACKTYLIIRDIFPQWAVDMGLMKRGLAFHLLNRIAEYQYSVADTIGVQTPGNLSYFDAWTKRFPMRKLEVLANWLGAPGEAPATIDFAQTSLKGRKVFVYAGNMGIAQNMDVIIELAQLLREDDSVGFALVGRGSERERLEGWVRDAGLTNVVFFGEIDPDEIPALYQQSAAGIVTLDPRHRSHNIPGKFISYMQCGLPVLANVNAGNDLAGLIHANATGAVLENGTAEALAEKARGLLSELEKTPDMSQRCQDLFAREFAVEGTVRAITASLKVDEQAS
jgi:glycosyltransferase involved in cell wall biosynthesis